ncbi:MAG: alpha-glucoside-specific PTS transporter subunit IIBC [Atopobiaceae bacterium]|jgi:PTS system arbutin-like IIC component|nr:alpha-glucoside-specific PTS transporter subunit IIBC [Atopobiaceae bacterium]MCH4180316.1 alpha-glucoside-specific PTS transporter subunit IIBC [Atopobiaceae bacterium]MCH4214874.1 alpha-glucoside-specific PTS transporter subunit IIBC [Atopobiaceae bacterium]MCH4229311.1 alpha-glucoside-specific PTS transporter subunit IIBC [Atopobiaceae bacterium]MCH4276366.1 alpha-glucoside-specific PTS transporter subunit IIBC [Atopobiaceae bacterium]
MMQRIQRFGGAMFTPVLLFAFAGMVVGIGTLFTTETIFGDLAAKGTVWYDCWSVVLAGGWTVFNQIPLLFAVSLPIGLATKQNARCCMEVLVAYLTFNYFVNAILTAWGPQLGVDFSAEVGNASGLASIAGIKTLDMGMIGALAISGVVIWLHDRLFDTELPEWLGVFSGSTFVYMVSFVVMIPLAVLACLLWPKVQVGMHVFQGFIMTSGALGVWVFVFLERILIPFGLHHLLYAPFYYDNVVVDGGIYAAFAKQLPQIAASTDSLKDLAPYASYTATGWSKVFGCPGIALAFYATARPERRKELLALLIPITVTAVLCGVTEPIEFTFLFVAPPLFLVHALLAATLSMVLNLLGVVGVFSGGLIEMASLNLIPLAASHGSTYLVALGVGLCFTAIYFVVFRFLIIRFDFRTPGREDDEEQVEFKSRKQVMEARAREATGASDGGLPEDRWTAVARASLGLLGGADNIVDVSNCATRLRVSVVDEALVGSDEDFKAAGALGCAKSGRSVQVIIGLSVVQVRERFEALLGR